MEVYQIILEQLGGHKFIAMTGANLMYGDNYLTAKIKGCKKYNHVEIKLNSKDLYDIRFFKMGNVRTMFAISNEKQFSDVYASDMKKLIESETGLYLSL